MDNHENLLVEFTRKKFLMSLLQWSLRTLSASGLTGWAAWEVDLLKHKSKLYPLGGQGGAGESG